LLLIQVGQQMSKFTKVESLTRVNVSTIFLGDLVVSWWRCKKSITSLPSTNPFTEPLKTAFESREKMLMENPILASAVYVDPRLHHKNTPKQFLGELAEVAEVYLNVIFLKKYYLFK
jgi:hypothetical protein